MKSAGMKIRPTDDEEIRQLPKKSQEDILDQLLDVINRAKVRQPSAESLYNSQKKPPTYKSPRASRMSSKSQNQVLQSKYQRAIKGLETIIDKLQASFDSNFQAAKEPQNSDLIELI